MIFVGNIYAGLSGSGGGGVLTLSNGLLLDGTNGIIGGQLDRDTAIDLNSFQWLMNGVGSFQVVIADDPVTPTKLANLVVGPTEILMTLNEPGARIGFDIDLFGDGIIVSDEILLAGMHYEADYSGQGIALYGDRWIPDVGYLKQAGATPGIVAKWATENISATAVMTTYPTSTSQKSTLRVSVSLFADIGGGGSVKTSVTFTDQDFNVITIDLGAALTGASGNAFYPPLTIQANVNTNVIVTTTVVAGGVNATSTGVIELLQLT